jgi:hypothetical protein
VLTLASLCHGNTRMLGDLLGVSRQAASETVRRARRDTSPVPPTTQPSSGTAMRRRGRRPR